MKIAKKDGKLVVTATAAEVAKLSKTHPRLAAQIKKAQLAGGDVPPPPPSSPANASKVPAFMKAVEDAWKANFGMSAMPDSVKEQLASAARTSLKNTQPGGIGSGLTPPDPSAFDTTNTLEHGEVPLPADDPELVANEDEVQKMDAAATMPLDDKEFGSELPPEGSIDRPENLGVADPAAEHQTALMEQQSPSGRQVDTLSNEDIREGDEFGDDATGDGIDRHNVGRKLNPDDAFPNHATDPLETARRPYGLNGPSNVQNGTADYESKQLPVVPDKDDEYVFDFNAGIPNAGTVGRKPAWLVDGVDAPPDEISDEWDVSNSQHADMTDPRNPGNKRDSFHAGPAEDEDDALVRRLMQSACSKGKLTRVASADAFVERLAAMLKK